MPEQPTFHVETTTEAAGESLVVALPQLGMANLTAVNYLVEQAGGEPIGHLDTEDLPAMTPVQEGRPRRHTRLFDLPELGVTALLGELFIPVWAAGGFAEALGDWVLTQDLEEILVLHGVPFPHAETEHTVFTVATADFQERRLSTTDFDGLPGGIFDGVPGELLDRNLDEADLPVGALVTPTHPPGPDMEASLRLLEAFRTIYGLEIDLGELQEAAEQTRQYYAELADRMQALQAADEGLGSRDYPEDRMYM